MIIKRLFSSCYVSPCRYEYRIIPPVIGTIICGTFFTSLILDRIRSNDRQLMQKLYEIEEKIQKQTKDTHLKVAEPKTT